MRGCKSGNSKHSGGWGGRGAVLAGGEGGPEGEGVRVLGGEGRLGNRGGAFVPGGTCLMARVGPTVETMVYFLPPQRAEMQRALAWRGWRPFVD